MNLVPILSQSLTLNSQQLIYNVLKSLAVFIDIEITGYEETEDEAECEAFMQVFEQFIDS